MMYTESDKCHSLLRSIGHEIEAHALVRDLNRWKPPLGGGHSPEKKTKCLEEGNAVDLEKT